jgi:PAS domain-containing protein
MMTTKTAQQAVEMILVRQLASYLFVPVLVVDATGTVVFYNEPAERILGVRFEETGPIDRDEADRLIELSEDPSAGAEDSERPLEVALQQRRPAHARRWLLRRADRVRLQVELTAFPIIDHEERLLGAVAMFWERHGP